MIFNYNYLDFLLILKEVFFLSIVVLSICIYTLFEKIFNKFEAKLSLFYSVALYFILILNIYFISALSTIRTSYYLFNSTLSNINSMDSYKLILIILIILLFYASISEKSFRNIKYIPFEANYILSFVFIGIIFLLYSFDFLMVFLNLELQNFSLYILMNIQRNKKYIVETCIKYYILGGLSSALLLYGISLFYGYGGKIRFSDLTFLFSEIETMSFSLYLGIFFFLCGLFIKLGLAPFHFWMPQIYSGVPSLITLILLTLPKFGLFIFYMKIYLFVFKFIHFFFFDIVCIVVILSLSLGSLGALGEQNIKRFMAYSAITNSGFILLSFSLFTFEGTFSGLLYLIIYIFTTFSVFYIFYITKLKQFNDFFLVEFKNFNCLKLINPTLVFILSINLLSMAGVPPLSGFFSKYSVFLALIEANNLKLVVFLIIISLISTYYYIRPVNLLVFTNNTSPKFLVEMTYFSGIVITLIFFFNCFLILQPHLILDLIQGFLILE